MYTNTLTLRIQKKTHLNYSEKIAKLVLSLINKTKQNTVLTCPSTLNSTFHYTGEQFNEQWKTCLKETNHQTEMTRVSQHSGKLLKMVLLKFN